MSIELIFGPMFTGKTETLIHLARIAGISGKSSLLVKFSDDTRYSSQDEIVTHSGDRQGNSVNSETGALIKVVLSRRLSEIEVDDKFEIIGIDEGQFFPDLVDCCKKWASAGKRVIVSALDGDYLRRPFGEICNLVPLCDSVRKKKGICMDCRCKESLFSYRLNKSDNIIDIGSRNKYKSLCRECYEKLKT